MRGVLLLLGVVICVVAVHPSCGRAEPAEENGNDYREVRPGPGAEVENISPKAQGSDSPSQLQPKIAMGTISGLRTGGNPEMELRLRPQSNGFLHGELVIHQSGFGMTPLDGYVRGNQMQFQVPYGSETYYFEGELRNDQISGTFESTPSGERGTWTARVN
jgi:hypothetical protein